MTVPIRKVSSTASTYWNGKRLLKVRHPVLLDYLNREISLKLSILEKLKCQAGERIEGRIREMENEIEDIRQAKRYFD